MRELLREEKRWVKKLGGREDRRGGRVTPTNFFEKLHTERHTQILKNVPDVALALAIDHEWDIDSRVVKNIQVALMIFVSLSSLSALLGPILKLTADTNSFFGSMAWRAFCCLSMQVQMSSTVSRAQMHHV